MEKLVNLKNATYNRLLSINNEIRSTRKAKSDISSLVKQRKQTDKLLSEIKKEIISNNNSNYKILLNKFLNPSIGEDDAF